MEQQENKRRHSIDASTIAEMPRNSRRVSFCGIDDKSQTQPYNRRHSMMTLQEGKDRRHSMDHRDFKRSARRFSIQPLHELSLTTFSGLPVQRKPVVMIENTYQLEPDLDTRFKTHVVRSETEKVMKKVLSESRYMAPTTKLNKSDIFRRFSSGNTGGELAMKLVAQVKDRLKTLKMERYKLVVNAFVGDNCDQGLMIASKSLWSTETDSYVTVVQKNAKKYAVVVVHGVYYE